MKKIKVAWKNIFVVDPKFELFIGKYYYKVIRGINDKNQTKKGNIVYVYKNSNAYHNDTPFKMGIAY